MGYCYIYRSNLDTSALVVETVWVARCVHIFTYTLNYIHIYIYTYIYIYIYINRYLTRLGRRLGQLSMVAGLWSQMDGECLWMSWSLLCMRSQCVESLCCMIVYIRFAILHLFIYASLYPPAPASSPRGRSCVGVSRDLHDLA